jgi:hypothetical protein
MAQTAAKGKHNPAKKQRLLAGAALPEGAAEKEGESE